MHGKIHSNGGGVLPRAIVIDSEPAQAGWALPDISTNQKGSMRIQPPPQVKPQIVLAKAF